MISGAAISAQQTAEAMANRGHKVLVIAASDRKYAYHTYKDNLTVLRLRSFTNPLRVGQRFIPNPRRRVMKALKQFKPDVIHAHEPLQMGALALRYAKFTHIPVLLTTHQLPWFVASYLPEKLKPAIEKTFWMYARISLKRYTRLISPTQTIATIIKEMIGLTPKVISYGLDLQTFHPPLHPDLVTASRKKLDLPSNIPLLLHVGRLDTDKSVENVVRAATPVIRESEAHLLIVGDGKQKQHLIRLCNEMEIKEKIHFTGFIHPSKLPEIYRMANIFVTASEIETQGIVLLEAAASGLPIVAVDATCISEAVHDKVNGLLVRSGDTNAFSEAILTLINDPNGAYKMGMNGRTLVSGHDIQNTWTLHENLYLEMAGQTESQPTTTSIEWLPQWDFLKTLIGLE
jgi:glycosyltransferase involved in cell wall biosynthesis